MGTFPHTQLANSLNRHSCGNQAQWLARIYTLLTLGDVQIVAFSINTLTNTESLNVSDL